MSDIDLNIEIDDLSTSESIILVETYSNHNSTQSNQESLQESLQNPQNQRETLDINHTALQSCNNICIKEENNPNSEYIQNNIENNTEISIEKSISHQSQNHSQNSYSSTSFQRISFTRNFPSISRHNRG